MGSGEGQFTEIEQKYDAGPEFTLPDLTGCGGAVHVTGPVTHRLTATYFDTPSLRLAGARITLRRRTGGTDAGWHVKLPGGADTRREIRFPAGRATGAVPARVAAVVAEWAAEEPLGPIARLVTTRAVRELTGSAGQVLAEVADDLVAGSLAAARHGDAAAAGSRQPGGGQRGVGQPGWLPPARWREIEVELAVGGRDLLAEAGERLRAAGAVPSRSGSKLARLLASGSPGGPAS